mmetsp:Transcript_51728/g.112446  ORF Transcript_51728/g.112446 Transcript_51728/m.112446 type:complete len:97 (-) Transcript_51728:148-438(-)
MKRVIFLIIQLWSFVNFTKSTHLAAPRNFIAPVTNSCKSMPSTEAALMSTIKIANIGSLSLSLPLSLYMWTDQSNELRDENHLHTHTHTHMYTYTL